MSPLSLSSAILVVGSLAAICCSAAPTGSTPPIVAEGPAHPLPTGGGASGATGDPPAGPDADGGSSYGPTPPCTALALCCTHFATDDPAQAWCDETLAQATCPEDCEGFVTYFGC